MRKHRCSLIAVALLTSVSYSAAQLVVHDFVEVGNPNNQADLTGYGSVGYSFKISKYETTVDQYSKFLNAVATTDYYNLYNTSMASGAIIQNGVSNNRSYSAVEGYSKKPISYVSWFDVARYCNWLHNGAGVGANTETGAYTLNGANSGIIMKNTDARFWIPTENEWYKAAYFDSIAGGYWRYATQSNTIGDSQANLGWSGGNPFTDVGYFSAYASAYGTYDQSGNASEWNDAVIGINARGARGGAFFGGAPDPTVRDTSYYYNREGGELGFRVAMIPEPSSLSLLALGGVVVALRRRRR